MVKINSSLFLGTLVACVLISSVYGALDIDGAFQNTWFFQRLTAAEKRALISLAIAYHDAPESADYPVVFPTNPIKPKADEIPSTLFTSMMNGNVPKQWMKNFVRWLRTKLDVTEHSFNSYRNDEVDILCTANNLRCYNITDVGQKCCPFG